MMEVVVRGRRRRRYRWMIRMVQKIGTIERGIERIFHHGATTTGWSVRPVSTLRGQMGKEFHASTDNALEAVHPFCLGGFLLVL
jgi:hypothetical protein